MAPPPNGLRDQIPRAESNAALSMSSSFLPFRVSVGQRAVESEKLGKEVGKGLGEKVSVDSTDQSTEKATETEKKIIALMRENKSITQNAIAEKLGVTRNYVAKSNRSAVGGLGSARPGASA
jgi:DNA-binding transcriptional regulator YiaG